MDESGDSPTGDLARARQLLEDLVSEVAPLARDEAAERTALEAAQAAARVSEKATRELGVMDADNDSASENTERATGAYAVWWAAKQAADSVAAQRLFHTQRRDWMATNFAPLKGEYEDAKAASEAIQLQIEAQETVLMRAKNACKRAAFGVAV